MSSFSVIDDFAEYFEPLEFCLCIVPVDFRDLQKVGNSCAEITSKNSK